MSTDDTAAAPATGTPAAPAPAAPKADDGKVRLLNKGASSLVVALEGKTHELPPGESRIDPELWAKLQTKEAVQFWLAPFEKVFIRSKDGPTTVERKPLLDKAGKRVPPTLEVLKG